MNGNIPELTIEAFHTQFFIGKGKKSYLGTLIALIHGKRSVFGAKQGNAGTAHGPAGGGARGSGILDPVFLIVDQVHNDPHDRPSQIHARSVFLKSIKPRNRRSTD